MIEEFSAKGYGCLRDVTVKLTPLHAFIGPNDSGKSTLLRAVNVLCMVATWQPGTGSSFNVQQDGFARLKSAAGQGARLKATVASSREYEILWDGYWMERNDATPEHHFVSQSTGSILLPSNRRPEDEGLSSALAGSRVARLRPEELRRPTPLIDGKAPLRFQNEHGLGLGSVLDAIRDRNEDAWRALTDDLLQRFPSLRRFQLQVREGAKKVVAAELRDGTNVGVDELSEGFLYYLAFAAMQHFDPVAVLCVEEPENGLHPARIREVINILRAISKAGTQVLLTTHSPLVINELLPSEVTLLTRPKDGGTVATRLIDVPQYRERIEKDALLPGEFWVSYCDGKFEDAILHPPKPET